MKLTIVKVGGNVIEDEVALSNFLTQFSALDSAKILVHGGGVLAAELAQQLGIEQQMINGRRVTDSETLKIITMVYAGFINKSVVAKLQALQQNAVGLSGADGNVISADKRSEKPINFGYVGDVKAVHEKFLMTLIQEGCIPVIAPLSHDGKGTLLNVNADTIAREIAIAMSAHIEVNVVYCFDKKGVLEDVNNEDSVIPSLSFEEYQKGLANKQIHAGMIPKLDNAFEIAKKGVKVSLGKATDVLSLSKGTAGTRKKI